MYARTRHTHKYENVGMQLANNSRPNTRKQARLFSDRWNGAIFSNIDFQTIAERTSYSAFRFSVFVDLRKLYGRVDTNVIARISPSAVVARTRVRNGETSFGGVALGDVTAAECLPNLAKNRRFSVFTLAGIGDGGVLNQVVLVLAQHQVVFNLKKWPSLHLLHCFFFNCTK